MTHDLRSHPASDDGGLPWDHEAAADDYAGLASMLSDAYDGPPVPKSLVRKLDEGFADQWGYSPGLVTPRFAAGARLIKVSKHLTRSWPVAAGLAAMLMLAFVFSGSSSGYAWANVIDAIKRQGMIQITDGDGIRWLHLSRGVFGQQTEKQTQWIDLRRQRVLRRITESTTLQRDTLPVANEDDRPDPLLVAFLSGQPFSAETLDRLSGLRVLDQQWQTRTEQSRDVIDLRVRFEAEDGGQFSLAMQLDPESKLPLSVRSDQAAKAVKLSYPRESVDELQSRHFPSDLKVVDLGRDPGEAVAASDLQRVASDLAADQPNSQDLAVNQETPDDQPGQDLDSSERAAHDAAVVATLPIGAANRWTPVSVIPASESEVVQRIDEILEELWRREQIDPVDAASDVRLLRRAYLDLAGRIPTVTEVRSFLKDPAADRYERLIDELLVSPDHASQMAAVWRSFLIPEGVDLDDFGGREAFEKWLSERFAAGESYDQIVRQLLLAEGRLSQSGPLLFYSALKLDAHQLAARTSRVFLGVRLECAQCHDHPFEPWTQEDFWSYAAFFAQISRPKGELENVSTVMRVRDIDRGDVMLPETDIIMPPRFLGQAEPEAMKGETEAARRERLASWLTGPKNPYFARATVNRVWAQLFGRGIVDPVDDFGVNHPPVSPELLDALASQFIDSGFDLRTLVRSIALSRAYRLASSSGQTPEANVDRRLETFAQMNVKTLTAEQLYDCIAVATMLDRDTVGNNTIARFGNSRRAAFLQQFATPATNRAEYLAGIPQALMLMNGPLITGATGESSSGLIRSLQAPFFTNRQRIDVIFMATLSRPASPEEIELLEEFIPVDASTEKLASGLADLLWALINSAEFTLNH